MVPVFSPKANARKICCIQLLKDWRIWMEESRSQRPKGDLSFQLLGIICLPAMRESSKSRMIWESAENHLGNPKGHPKVAENPRKRSAAQLEKRQPNGLKVCSIWWARRASSLPRRRNHKKECLLLIRVSTFHNLEHQPTCLCTTLAFVNWGQFGSIETIICKLQILSFEASQYSLLQVYGFETRTLAGYRLPRTTTCRSVPCLLWGLLM